jgi:hypothetical protein
MRQSLLALIHFDNESDERNINYGKKYLIKIKQKVPNTTVLFRVTLIFLILLSISVKKNISSSWRTFAEPTPFKVNYTQGLKKRVNWMIQLPFFYQFTSSQGNGMYKCTITL